jgi:fused signal recognition particle receptor
MARDWKDLFIVDGTGASGPDTQREPDAGGDEPRVGRLRRLRASLRRTRQALSSEIQATLFEESQSEATWERLEEALIYADVGAGTTAKVVEDLEREATEGSISGGEALSARLIELLAQIARTGDDRIDLRAKPTVILVAGVNGTGKTTTAGKLAFHIKELGQSVVLGAADTFRAAGVEQLEQWAQRADVSFVKGPEDADPGSVAYDAIATARRDGADVVIIDTAGRLHTQEDLMAELSKVSRVIAKQIPDAPHETLLTVDATTGQNGLRQASLFSAAIGVDGLVLTKLDGTAKGGIVLAIAHELGIPVKLIGVGEQLEDLRPFDPTEFARALVGRE